MNKIKRLFGAFFLIGTTTFIAAKPSNKSIVVEESKTIIEDDCSISAVSDYVDKYLVRLEKTAPAVVSVDENFSYNYVVTAKDKLKKVVVEERIPKGATYVSSSPSAQIDEDVVTWTLYNLGKSEIVSLELVVNASTIADLSNCATVVAYPEACTTTSVCVPELAIQTTTTVESVLINSSVLWNVTIANTGNFCAKNVVITNALPDGLMPANGNISQIIEIGSLAPGDSREIIINTTAVKDGELCNVAVVTASNASPAQDETCINVLESGLEISTEGPQKQFVGKKAVYTTSVINTGDIPFRDVIVTSKAPYESKLTKAKDAEMDGNEAIWLIDLDAGEEKTFEVEILITEEGSFCNEVSVSTIDSSLSKSDSICTKWSGYPALLMEVLDTQDPLIVGEETTYIVQIANQGTAADTNVNLNIQIPEGLTIVSAAGDTQGTITGNEVSFAPYPILRAKEIIQFRVIAKAVDTGDLRFKAQMTSDLLKTPVPEEESTQVY